MMNAMKNVENNPLDMAGQWFGKSYSYESKTTSLIVVNIEPRFPQKALLVGMEYPSQTRTLAEATIELKDETFVGKTNNFQIYDESSHAVIPLSVFCEKYQVQGEPANEAEYLGTFDGNKLAGTWKNNLGQTGTFELRRSFSEATYGLSLPEPKEMIPLNWEEFKRHIAGFRLKGRVLFRGQHSNKYPVRTSFHRRGRNNLQAYLVNDVQRLRHQINAISPHYYQPTVEDLYGLLNLAQHHGFPTPFLDWTESPYVAAFFAFDCLTEKEKWLSKPDREPVRIFTFDLEAWRNVNRKLAQSLNDPCPDFQFFHPPANNNPRYYPQQSMAAFSNIDRIEDYIAAYEASEKKTFLTRIDILATERTTVEDELRFMGITPATLFPGFEGACKSLRAELF